ncbi:hypothetical protein CR513_15985, partial [Mucuna pruriens]
MAYSNRNSNENQLKCLKWLERHKTVVEILQQNGLEGRMNRTILERNKKCIIYNNLNCYNS